MGDNQQAEAYRQRNDGEARTSAARPARTSAPRVRITVRRVNAWPGGGGVGDATTEDVSITIPADADKIDIERACRRVCRAGVEIVVLDAGGPHADGSVLAARFRVASAARRETRAVLRVANALRRSDRAEPGDPDAVAAAMLDVAAAASGNAAVPLRSGAALAADRAAGAALAEATPADEPGLLLVEAAAPDGRPETVWRRCKFVAAADARSCYVVDATGGGKEKLRPFSSLLPFDEALEGRYRSGVEPRVERRAPSQTAPLRSRSTWQPRRRRDPSPCQHPPTQAPAGARRRGPKARRSGREGARAGPGRLRGGPASRRGRVESSPGGRRRRGRGAAVARRAGVRAGGVLPRAGGGLRARRPFCRRPDHRGRLARAGEGNRIPVRAIHF